MMEEVLPVLIRKSLDHEPDGDYDMDLVQELRLLYHDNWSILNSLKHHRLWDKWFWYYIH